jgi:hypothetical protein
MNTMTMKMILPFCLLMASTMFAPAIAADAAEDKQPPAATEEPIETWPSSVKSGGPLPGTCASFLDPELRLIERKDDSDEAKDDEKKKDSEKKDDGKKTDKKEKQKKPRANAYTNPESTSCIV